MDNKILHRKLIHNVAQSYTYSTDTPFTVPLHCHAEYELIYIISGQGQEFIGDSVKRYDVGDLVLIGGNVPHLHLCDTQIDKALNEKSFCNILQFPHNIFPENLAEIQEYSFINSVLEQSSYGIRFNSREVVKNVLKIMRTINRKQGIERIITLFKILDTLGKSKDTTLVSTIKSPPIERFLPTNNEPLNIIYSYLLSNFKKAITLSDIANYVKLNPTSLCRYFKQGTGKTVFDCLNEMRIEHACKLLSHSTFTISQIAYEVGFNNLSHFNKQFKNVTKQTPTEYKKYLIIEI